MPALRRRHNHRRRADVHAAQRWLDEQTAKLAAGTHVAPRQARMTVGEWCDVRRTTSHVRTWCAQLAAEGLADSYVYALHTRLAQVYSDAVHDGLVA